VGHVVAPEPTSAGRHGLKLQLMWQRVDAHPTPCLDLELVCEVPDLQGTDSGGSIELAKAWWTRRYGPPNRTRFDPTQSS
jgi:hypothetical protein